MSHCKGKCSKSEPCSDCSHDDDPVQILQKQLLGIHQTRELILKMMGQAATVRQMQSMLDGQYRSKSLEEMEMTDQLKQNVREGKAVLQQLCDLCPDCEQCQIPDMSTGGFIADRGHQF